MVSFRARRSNCSQARDGSFAKWAALHVINIFAAYEAIVKKKILKKKKIRGPMFVFKNFSRLNLPTRPPQTFILSL